MSDKVPAKNKTNVGVGRGSLGEEKKTRKIESTDPMGRKNRNPGLGKLKRASGWEKYKTGPINGGHGNT